MRKISDIKEEIPILHQIAVEGIDIMEEYQSLTDEGRYEVLLLNSLFVLDIYRYMFQINEQIVHKEYIKLLQNKHEEFKFPIESLKHETFFAERSLFYSNMNKNWEKDVFEKTTYNFFTSAPFLLIRK